MMTRSRARVGSSLSMVLAIVLLAMVSSFTLPNYLTGHWAWTIPPKLSATHILHDILDNGILLPHWIVLEQQTIDLSHKKWSAQVLSPEIKEGVPLDPSLSAQQGKFLAQDPVFLFLRPQSNVQDEPLVEWIDLDGMQRWTTDQHQTIHFSVPSSGYPVTAHYFRGWNRKYTYAVVQWYSWPTGGNPNISSWFWADQQTQWSQHQRMPWVAVSVLIPIEPMGDIDVDQPLVEAIAQEIQTALVKDMLTALSAS